MAACTVGAAHAGYLCVAISYSSPSLDNVGSALRLDLTLVLYIACDCSLEAMPVYMDPCGTEGRGQVRQAPSPSRRV